jgi:hypothetical protein
MQTVTLQPERTHELKIMMKITTLQIHMIGGLR